MRNESDLLLGVALSGVICFFILFLVAITSGDKQVKVCQKQINILEKQVCQYQFLVEENQNVLRKECSRYEKKIETLSLRKDGVKYEIKNLGVFEVTAYTTDAQSCGVWADGYTATGERALARKRLCASDWKILPVGSKVYVMPEWAGWYRVADKGGAIKGNKLDLLVETNEQAYKIGRIKCRVYSKH